MSRILIAAILAATAWPGGADAQNRQPERNAPAGQDRWLATDLMDAQVYGGNYEIIGEVDDILVTDGDVPKADSLIVETDETLGLGGERLTVPWSDVSRGDDLETVAVPVTAGGAADDYDEYEAGQAVGLRVEDLSAWPMSLMLGTSIELDGARASAQLDDIVIAPDGTLRTAVIAPLEGVGGPYAVPWSDLMLELTAGYLISTLSPDDLEDYERFDPPPEEAFAGPETAVGADGGGGMVGGR